MRSAASSLSCEQAVLWLPGYVATQPALRSFAGVADWPDNWDGQPTCEQNSRRNPLPAPLSPDDGVTSHLIVPLGAPTQGMLVVAHTNQSPRGFTTLCQRVAHAVAQAAGPVIDAAQNRTELQQLVDSAEQAARRDALTALANRRAWDEALQAAASVPLWISLAMIDLNDLKLINDSAGHQAGDDYLRAAARQLLAAARPGDVVARIGGDEFGILRCSVQPLDRQSFDGEVRAAFPADGPVKAAIGIAQCGPGEDLEQAVRRADVAMYLDKSIATQRTPLELRTNTRSAT